MIHKIGTIMAPLSEVEVEELAAGIQQALSSTRYACSSLSRIAGGSASYTFRGLLQTPITHNDGTSTTTFIAKKATDFAAINTDFALDSNRSACCSLFSMLKHE
jgi:hypothetical protein